MPAQRKITDDPQVVADKLAASDLPTVAREYDVTPTAVQQFLRRHGLYERKMPDHSDVIPWRLAPQHGMDHEVRMLRLLGRRKKGMHVPDDESDLLDAWLAQMDEKNVVVTYDRARGFEYDYRREGETGYARPGEVRVRT